MPLARDVAKRVAALVEALLGKPQGNVGAAIADTSAAAGFDLDKHLDNAREWVMRSPNETRERAIYHQMSAFILLATFLIKRDLDSPNVGGRLEAQRLVLPYEKVDTNPQGADDGTRVDVGLALCNKSRPVATQDKPSYRQMAVAVEAKGKQTERDTNDAYAQLFDYTRNMYYDNLRRRFAWGLICCGTVVNACLFANYRAYASPDIDMASLDGRRMFIGLLVGWTVCDLRQMGLDETISFDDSIGCYSVQVPKLDSPTEYTKYYADTMIVGAERLFGRHCRCLLATEERPTEMVTLEKPLKHTTVIKDSWTIYTAADDAAVAVDADVNATGDSEATSSSSPASASEPKAEEQIVGGMARMDVRGDAARKWPTDRDLEIVESVVAGSSAPGTVSPGIVRSEVNILRTINEKLKKKKDLAGSYPTIKAGGWVRHMRDGKQVLDTTREIIDGLTDEQQQDTPFCLHVRYAMMPIGQRLEEVESVLEYIIVLRNVMRCVMALHDECEILHRDISDGNILIWRDENGHVHGMLIDFDCALDMSVAGLPIRQERTGTPCFMSVANLEGLLVDHTTLDEWESALYLTCWKGVFGVNSKFNPPANGMSETLKTWGRGELADIGASKRKVMDSAGHFEVDVLDRFYPEQDDIGILGELASALYYELFYNKQVKEPCHGALPKRPKRSLGNLAAKPNPFEGAPPASQPGEQNDPFVKRVGHADTISADLMKVELLC
ncbi:hypothetical protein H4R19_003291 [Coemansia spiralis]|nr:hypothetical protein H4R19_003291 [Coemansia spiralis]